MNTSMVVNVLSTGSMMKIYSVSQKKGIDKNFNSNLIITLIHSFSNLFGLSRSVSFV